MFFTEKTFANCSHMPPKDCHAPKFREENFCKQPQKLKIYESFLPRKFPLFGQILSNMCVYAHNIMCCHPKTTPLTKPIRLQLRITLQYCYSTRVPSFQSSNLIGCRVNMAHMVCTATDLQQQAAHNNVNYGRRLKLFQEVRAVHKRHSNNYAGDSGHDMSMKLSPSCVATVAGLAGEMTGICDTQQPGPTMTQ